MKIKPAPGMRVRDPVSKRPLPESGAEVQISVYWHRRLAAGDVVEVVAPESVLVVDGNEI